MRPAVVAAVEAEREFSMWYSALPGSYRLSDDDVARYNLVDRACQRLACERSTTAQEQDALSAAMRELRGVEIAHLRSQRKHQASVDVEARRMDHVEFVARALVTIAPAPR